jgi:polysaccharide biosynthesis protein PslH
MNYLWLIRWPPYAPINSGDASSSRNQIEHLARFAKIEVLTCETPGVTPKPVPNVIWRQIPTPRQSKIASLFSSLPSVASRHRTAAYIAAMAEAALRADAIIVDHVGMSWCVPELRKVLGSGGPPLMLINHNHEASLRGHLQSAALNPLVRLAVAWDARKAARLERIANRWTDGYTVVTTSDFDAFRKDAPDTPGILSMPGYSGPKTSRRMIDRDTPPRICILGGRGPFHKQLVLQDVLRELAKRDFANRFIIDVLGAGMEERLTSLRMQYPSFNFLGYVDDLQSYFQTVRLGLIPDRYGGGFKVRALNHIFMRTPMLAVRGALSGMTLRDGVDFICADTLVEVLDMIPNVIEDIDRLNAVQNTAYEYCEYKFDWNDRVREMDDFARELRRRKGLPEIPSF